MSNEIVDIISKARNKKSSTLDEVDSKCILRALGVPCIAEREITGIDDLKSAAEEFGFPLVIKGIGQGIGHKSELGLVKVNLYNLDDAKKALYDISSKKEVGVEKIIVQPQIIGSREFVAGLFRDPDFGSVVVFGLGGIYTEALQDISLKICPLTYEDGWDCIHEIKSSVLLENFRGDKAVDKEKIIQILMALSSLGERFEDIKEIDINPIVVTPEGDPIVVDCLIGLEFIKKQKKYPEPVDPSRLHKFFYPRSVVFVGASAKLGKWGHLLPTNVISGGYKGDIYFVNAKGGRVLGREVFKSIKEIPDSIDLAVVTIPGKFVLDLIPELAKKNIKQMLLIAAGFGETGEEGKKLQEEMVLKAKEHGIVIIGPNTMGLSNPHASFHCIGTLVQPKPGNIGMVSQSGNMGVQLLSFADQQGIGIRGFCGSGNEAMICIEDYLESFEEDDLTTTVMLYVESVKNGRRFFEVAKRVSKKKPIILLKGGETEAGVKAAATHTGAMASNVKVFNAMCIQSGIVKVDAPTDLLDLAASFSSLPLPRGNKVVIITLGGGWGVITADLCAKYGLELAQLPQEIIKFIDEFLPDFWSRTNPIDLVGEWDIEIPKRILDKVLEWDGCDAVINLGILGRKFFMQKYTSSIERSDPSYSPEFLKQIREMVDYFEREFIEVTVKKMEQYKKPIFGVRLNTEPGDKTIYEVEGACYNAVCYNSPEDAVKACARMFEYYKYISRAK